MSATADNCPTWLNELRGESPVLSASEWRLLVKVRSMAQKEFGVNTSSVHNGEMSKELSSLVEKLNELIHHLKMCEKSRRDFQEHYLRWRPIRNKTIKILREIADAIQKKKEETNKDKFVGSFASLVGGAVAIAVRSHPVVSLIAGGIALLSSVGAYGSSVAEAKLIEEKLKEAEATVNDDRQHFDIIWSWLVNSSELWASANQIYAKMGGNGHVWKNATKEIESFLCDKKERNGIELYMLIKQMLNAVKIIKISLEHQEEMSEVVTAIMAICMLLKHNSSLLKLASSGSRIKTRLAECARGHFFLTDKFEDVQLNCAQNSMVILGMILEIMKLFDISTDIKKGSPSMEYESVKKIIRILESEADALKTMYDESRT